MARKKGRCKGREEMARVGLRMQGLREAKARVEGKSWEVRES